MNREQFDIQNGESRVVTSSLTMTNERLLGNMSSLIYESRVASH